MKEKCFAQVGELMGEQSLARGLTVLLKNTTSPEGANGIKLEESDHMRTEGSMAGR